MILLSSHFLKREKERKYWGHPILRYREEGEFPLLITEQQDYHGRYKVCFRMSVAQFDALLNEVDELDNRRSGFWRSLVRWLWIVKTPLKTRVTDAKNAENRTRKFQNQCATAFIVDTMISVLLLLLFFTLLPLLLTKTINWNKIKLNMNARQKLKLQWKLEMLPWQLTEIK